MADVIAVAVAIGALWVFGECVLRLIDGSSVRFRWLGPVAGLTVAAIAVNLLYFGLHLEMRQIRLVLLFLCAAGILYLGFTWRRSPPALPPLLWCLGMYALLALPGLIGGEQYYVFRGNWWDHFTYITAAFGFANHPVTAVAGFDRAAILANELLAFAQGHYEARPSVMLLFSLFLTGGAGDLFFRAFLYTSALLALAYPPLYLLCCRLQGDTTSGGRPSRLLYVIPVGYVAGFWGQYIFDINAWGQLASLSLTLGFVTAYSVLLEERASGTGGCPPVPPYAVTLLLLAGSWLLYPENTLFHLGLTGAGTIVWYATVRPVPPLRQMAWLAALPLLSLLLTLPNYQATAGFIIRQASFGVGAQNDWWLHHDAYFAGIAPPMVDLAREIGALLGPNPDFGALVSRFWYLPFNSILALFGLYFVTSPVAAGGVGYLWLLLTVAAALLLSWVFIRTMMTGRSGAGVPSLLVRMSAGVGLVLFLYFLIRIRWWPAGKLLSYISPYLYLVMLLPVIRQDSYRLPLVSRLAACGLLGLSLCFGAARLHAAADRYGIGYYRNYPSIQGENNKLGLVWDFDAAAAAGCSAVNVDSLAGNPFYSHYVKLKLSYAGIRFYTTRPVVEYFGKNDLLGYMPAVPADCAVLLDNAPDLRIHGVVVRSTVPR